MGFYRGPKIVTNGLVLYLDAANKKSYPGTGTTWTDLSGLGNNGTLTNGPTFNSANGGSIVFDGTNDYVNLGNATNMNPSNGLTLSCWIYFSRIDVREIFIGKGDGIIANSNQYWIEKNANNTLQCLIVTNRPSVGAYEYRLSMGSTRVEVSRWYNLCMTYNIQILSTYINGVNTNNLNHNESLYTTNKGFSIGRMGDLAGYYLSGRISNVLFYNRGISASEVLQNYNATKGRFNL